MSYIRLLGLVTILCTMSNLLLGYTVTIDNSHNHRYRMWVHLDASLGSDWKGFIEPGEVKEFSVGARCFKTVHATINVREVDEKTGKTTYRNGATLSYGIPFLNTCGDHKIDFRFSESYMYKNDPFDRYEIKASGIFTMWYGWKLTPFTKDSPRYKSITQEVAETYNPESYYF